MFLAFREIIFPPMYLVRDPRLLKSSKIKIMVRIVKSLQNCKSWDRNTNCRFYFLQKHDINMKMTNY